MTELQSVVCNDTPIMMFRKFYHCLVWNLTHENVNMTTRRDTFRPGLTWSDDISARTWPGPLKFVNFRPKAGPYRPGQAYGPPGPCRALIRRMSGHHKLALKLSADRGLLLWSLTEPALITDRRRGLQHTQSLIHINRYINNSRNTATVTDCIFLHFKYIFDFFFTKM